MQVRNYKPSKLDMTHLKKAGSLDVEPRERISISWPIRKLDRLEPLRAPRLDLWRLAKFGLVSLALILLLPLWTYLGRLEGESKQILGAATSAYEDLDAATQDLQGQNFTEAEERFQAAKQQLTWVSESLQKYLPLNLVSPQAQSAQAAIAGAYELSVAGEALSEAMALFKVLAIGREGIEVVGFNDRLRENHRLLSLSLEHLSLAADKFDEVTDLPNEYFATLQAGRQQVAQLQATLAQLASLEEVYLALFDSGYKNYLLAFQNPDELRATGGFLGTYGELRLADGKIQHLNIASIYDVDGNIEKSLAAPGPLQPAIRKWGVRDANFFIDFPTSARKMVYLFEQGRASVDGVIAMNPKIFEELLRLTGPIHMSQYGVILTAANFQETVQYQTSVAYERELNQPKKFLADFAALFLARLQTLSSEQLISLLQILANNLNEKHLLVYSADPKSQAIIESVGLSGRVEPAEHDYLHVNNSNFGGTKTDLNTKQQLKLSTQILSDGAVLNTLRLRRDNQDIDRNASFVRVLVPLGSELISFSGMDPYRDFPSTAEGLETDPDLAIWDQGELREGQVFVKTEAGKTEFAFSVETKAAAQREITLSYLLPFRVKAGWYSAAPVYSLRYQKQPGITSSMFEQTLGSEQQSPIWHTSNVKAEEGKLIFSSDSSTDEFWGVVFSE